MFNGDHFTKVKLIVMDDDDDVVVVKQLRAFIRGRSNLQFIYPRA